MEIEAIDERSSNPLAPSRENGEARSATTEITDTSAFSRLAERIEQLEKQQGQLKREALMVAGLTTVAVALAVSMFLQQRFQPPMEAQPAVKGRTVSAQAFLLTDPQGHPRARLTFE